MNRRIVIAGASSHSGKTTIACGLLASFRELGLRVSAYKTGPDYIDPQYLRLSGGCEVYNLDTWLMTPERTLELFTETSSELAIIEGAMGLYDGGMNSTAGIAKLLRAPVIVVMNARSLGETAGAIALGLRDYDPDVNIAGVILNHVGSDSHVSIISDSLSRVGIRLLGAIKRNPSLTIPERHMGLLPSIENPDLPLEAIKHAVSTLDLEAILRLSESPDVRVPSHTLTNIPAKHAHIAVARDEAFSFYYPESMSTLERLGASLSFFSPIHDSNLPKADGYIFGGGFPEVFAPELEANVTMRESLREAVSQNVPVLAECGGMMYLCDSLTDKSGHEFRMSGAIRGRAFMTDRPTIGYIEARSLGDNIMCRKGEIVRGHEFHFSRAELDDYPAFEMTRPRTGDSRIGGYARDNVLASYLHVNFFGYPELARRFLSFL